MMADLRELGLSVCYMLNWPAGRKSMSAKKNVQCEILIKEIILMENLLPRLEGITPACAIAENSQS